MATELPERAVELARDGELRVGFIGRDYATSVADLRDDVAAWFADVIDAIATRLSERGAAMKYAATERVGASSYAVLATETDTTAANLLRSELVAALSELYDYATQPDVKFDSVPLCYVVIASDGDDTALFGRASTLRHVPKENSKLFPAIFRDGVLKALKPELILFDAQVDWIHYDGVFYIANMAAFENLFIDRERLAKRVNRNVKDLTKTLTISDPDAFAGRVAANINMTVKLQKIVDRGDYALFEIPDLKKYTQQFKPEMTWQGDTVVFDGSPKHQWDILTMLDEAWFSGFLSSRPYEATSKLDVAG